MAGALSGEMGAFDVEKHSVQELDRFLEKVPEEKREAELAPLVARRTTR